MKSVVLFSAFLLLTGASCACSCMPGPSVEGAYRASSVVFRGTIADLHREPMRLPDGKVAPSAFIESLTLRVVKSWKGTSPGHLVHLRTIVSPGSCGFNARTANTKVIDRDTGRSRNATVTEWLVYGSGREPFALEMCTRTAPTEGDAWGGINDVATLDWIVSHSTGK